MESLPAGSAYPCSEEEIKHELERLLASREFAHAGRLSRFLRFVVERTLAGDRESLKESVIGTAVYDRAPGYDPKVEPIVRTEARRMRAKLTDYYQNSGRDSGIQITIPTGGYMAVIEPRRPLRLAVLPKPEASEPAINPARHSGWARYIWTLAAAVVLVGAAALIVMSRLGAPGNRMEFALTTITSYPGGQYRPAISPDGRQVAFTWSDDPIRNTDLYVVSADGGAPKRLTTAHAADTLPAWSHDGKQIAFIRNNTLMVVSPLGGGERALGPAFPSWLSWAPEGNVLLVTDWVKGRNILALFAVDESNGSRRQLTSPPDGITGDTAGAVSPDGKRLAFIRCNLANCDIYTAAYERSDVRRLTHDETAYAGLAWMPDGRTIVFSSRRWGPYMLWQVNASGGNPEAVPSAGDDSASPRTARGPSGKVRLVFEHRVTNASIWRQQFTADGSQTGPASAPERVIASTRVDSSPQFSPDGKRIVFASDRTGHDEIWAADADGSNQRALTHLRQMAGSPRWAPDGNRIAFDMLGKNGRAVFLTDANGATPQQWTPWGNNSRPSWSRDGRWIYYGANDSSGETQVWKISTAPDQTIRQVTQDGGFEAFESFDGATLYYTRGAELRSMPLSGGPWKRITDRPVQPGWWGLSEKGIYFADLQQPKTDVFDRPFPVDLLDLQTGKIRPVVTIKGPVNRSTPDFAVTADGRTLFYCLLEVSTSQIRMLESQ